MMIEFEWEGQHEETNNETMNELRQALIGT